MERNSKKDINNEFEKIQAEILNKKCWSVIAGTGSLISLAFGGKIPNSRILKNKNLTTEQRNFSGQFEIYVECAWRLESEELVLCTSTCANLNDSEAGGLKSLVGDIVVDLGFCLPSGDLKISFSSGRTMKIFADQGNEVDQYINYIFYANDILIKNGANSNLLIMQRHDST